MFPQLYEVLPKLCRLIEKNTLEGRNTVVGITGGSCTGKSSQVGEGLEKTLPFPCVLLHQDHFQKGSNLENLNPIYRWDDPANFGIEESYVLLTKLKQNESYEMPLYDFKQKANVGHQKIQAKQVILFEGLYAAHNELVDVCDFIIYVEVPLFVRCIRRVFRNSFHRYTLSPQLVLDRLVLGGVYPAHYNLVVHQKKHAHQVMYNYFDFQQIIGDFKLKALPNPKFKQYDWIYALPNFAAIKLKTTKNGKKLYFFQNEVVYFKIPISQEALIALFNYLDLDDAYYIDQQHQSTNQ